MSHPQLDGHHFEGLPPGLIFFLGELSNKVDHIGTTLDQMRQSDRDMETRLCNMIFKEVKDLKDEKDKEIKDLKDEKDKEIEIIHKRIESSRNRLIGWFTGVGTMIAGLAAAASIAWG